MKNKILISAFAFLAMLNTAPRQSWSADDVNRHIDLNQVLSVDQNFDVTTLLANHHWTIELVNH